MKELVSQLAELPEEFKYAISGLEFIHSIINISSYLFLLMKKLKCMSI